jgi:protein phosphatase
MRLVGGAHSDVGQVRSNNQDAALADPAASIYAVADGMGGHRGGEVASAMALTTLSKQLRELGATDAPLLSAESLVDAVLGANDRVFEEAAGNAELLGMGTTLCAVALVGEPGSEQVAVVNVGDSRVYLLHERAVAADRGPLAGPGPRAGWPVDRR